MTGAEFEKRLHATFTEGGVPFKRAHLLFDREKEYGLETLKFGGYLALSDAFKCMFLESVELANTHIPPQIKVNLSEHYPQFVPRIVSAFHYVCGAERAALNGYPLPAYTTLRNVFDTTTLMSAAMQGLTNFYLIEGLDEKGQLIGGGPDFDPIKAKRARIDDEWKVRKKMTGKDSGLQPSTIDHLRKLDEMYDSEVHGARLSLADAMGYMKGKAPLNVLPKFKDISFAIFMNRYCEVCWTIHRLLPLIQPPDTSMPDAWVEKWEVLDDSFELTIRSLSKDLGKGVGDAYADFVQAKFPFSATSTFPTAP
jgi:hypothetical protein